MTGGPEALLQEAVQQLNAGRFEEAVEAFSAVLRINAGMAEALRGRGLASMQLRRWSQAAADFRAATAAAPDEADNWVDLGVCLALEDHIYPALEVFEALLAKQPDCVRGHLELGLLYLRLGAIPKGRQQLRQALASRPSLAHRRAIESILEQQNKLDHKRFYRPDFEALNQQRQGSSKVGWLGRLRTLLRSKFRESGGPS